MIRLQFMMLHEKQASQWQQLVVADHKNVESVLFADNEGAYLAGIAAAMQSKTKHVGFVGGVESDTITRFETGFKEGVASVDSSIKVDVQYAGSYSDSAKGKTIAATMYASGADVIYHAAGGSGTGVFSQAKEINEKLPADSDKKVWVVGVDRDQTAAIENGIFTSRLFLPKIATVRLATSSGCKTKRPTLFKYSPDGSALSKKLVAIGPGLIVVT